MPQNLKKGIFSVLKKLPTVVTNICVALLLLVGTFAFVTDAEAQVSVNSCGTFSQNNTTFTIGSSFGNNSNTCLTFTGDYITINGNGHYLHGGIHAQGRTVTINNLKLVGTSGQVNVSGASDGSNAGSVAMYDSYAYEVNASGGTGYNDNGADGAPGSAGVDGTPGTDGSPGTDGYDDGNGTPMDGGNGTDGTDGTSGSDGSTGTDGSAGGTGGPGGNGGSISLIRSTVGFVYTNEGAGGSANGGAGGPGGSGGIGGPGGIGGRGGYGFNGGMDGLPGNNGNNGSDGAAGANGNNGPDGSAGSPGNPGNSPVTISNLVVNTSHPSQTQVTISYTTDTASIDYISYGTATSSLTNTPSDALSDTSHSFEITGLSPGTTYYFKITSTPDDINFLNVSTYYYVFTINYVTLWGSSGSGNGQFSAPYGIAVDSNGNVYVVDNINRRVQKFNSSGTYITKWGSSGSGDGQFLNPTGIAIDSADNVYVVDSNNHRIQKFNTSGTYITKWGSSGSGNGQLNSPTGIATDSAGNVYVADSGNFRVQKFNSSGTYITKWGTVGSSDGQFSNVSNLAVDSANNVYVSDATAHRIQKFNSSGTYITKWGYYGVSIPYGLMQNPVGIAVDASDNVYVAESGNNRVQMFDSSGNFITTWGTNSGSESNFNGLRGIAINESDNSIYTTESNTNRVQKFSAAAGADTTNPTFTVSTTKPTGTYSVGEVIDVNFVFSESVTSTGNVTVTLETGLIDRTCTFTITSSTTASCNYTVQAGDNSPDITIKTISGVVEDAAANAVDFNVVFGALGNNVEIDTPPTFTVSTTVTSGKYKTGDPIDLNFVFSEPVSSVGEAVVYLETGVSDGNCSTFTITSTTTATCTYTVNTGESSSELTISNIAADVRDANNNLVDFDIAYTPLGSGVEIDAIAPTVTSVTSNKAAGTYTVGEVIDIRLQFSEVVTSSGGITVTLETGTVDRTCAANVTNATTTSCNYTVQAGDVSADLTVLSISGTIMDLAINPMTNFVPTSNLAANEAIVIDTSTPTISSISVTPVSLTSSQITWSTNEVASSSLAYGLTTSYGATTSPATTTMSHSVTLTGLTASTTYHYRILAQDFAGNTATTTDITFVSGALPTVTVEPASNITATVARFNAIHVNEGNASSTSWGFYYGTTTAYGSTLSTGGTIAQGSPFYIEATDLVCNTTYNYQGYVVSPLGTGSSTNATFTTSACTVSEPTPTVTSSGGGGGGGGGGSVVSQSPAVLNAVVPENICSVTLPASLTIRLGASNIVADVKALETFLNKFENAGLPVNGIYEQADFNAVVRWQEKYAADILRPNGLVRGTGIVSTSSLLKMRQMIGAACNTPVPTSVVQTTPTPTVKPTTINNTPSPVRFIRNLPFGTRSEAVRQLQIFLNTRGYVIANQGAGSPGNESTYFGPATRTALSRFQAASGIRPAVGVFGPTTRAYINGLR